jgi:histidinol dehydrogenase
MPVVLSVKDADFAQQFAALLDAKRENDADVHATVSEILAAVRQQGDQAVVDYTRRLDRLPTLTAETMRLSAEDINAAANQVSDELMASLRQAAERIRAYHLRQMPGALCARRHRSLSVQRADERSAGQGGRGRAFGDGGADP